MRQVIEKDVEVASRGNILSGTLCSPDSEGPAPVVVMIHGSGPLDRNENTRGQELNVFNAIAHGLSSNGIASLRYDKRGCGKSGGDYYRAGHADLVEDATAWADALNQSRFCACDQVFLLGHSEGCLIAPQVSIRLPFVAGLVLLCPTLERVEDTLMKQARQLERGLHEMPGRGAILMRLLYKCSGGPIKTTRRFIERVKTSTGDTLTHMFQKHPAKNFRELLALDAASIFKGVSCPILSVGAAKDLHCDPADAKRIAAASGGVVETHVLPNMTHTLRFDDHPASFWRYPELLRKPIEPIVSELVSRWVAGKRNGTLTSRGDR